MEVLCKNCKRPMHYMPKYRKWRHDRSLLYECNRNKPEGQQAEIEEDWTYFKDGTNPHFLQSSTGLTISIRFGNADNPYWRDQTESDAALAEVMLQALRQTVK